MPGERIELPTNGLQNRCSTAELTRRFSFPVSDLDSISDREGTRSATGLIVLQKYFEHFVAQH